jgi:hypothetical protein
MALDDPQVVIKNYLRDAWTASDVLGVTPDIHTGWLDDEGTNPELTVTNPDENPVATPFDAIDPSGAGPVQSRVGTVMVSAWASRKRTEGLTDSESGQTPINPKKLAYRMKDHAQDLVSDNYNATDANGNDTDLQALWPGPASKTVEDPDDVDEVLVRYTFFVGYRYQKRPN